MTIARHVKNASLALIALSSVGVLQGAYANGTPSGTNITNQATVDYSVGGVSQTQITSPTASFVVDSRIDFNVTQQNGPVVTQPGQTNVVAEFLVSNTGNSTQGYQLAVVNEATGTAFPSSSADNQDVANLRIFVDSNGNNTYDAGVDTATNVNSLITDSDGESVRVFVLADIPVAASNNQFANVRLTARAAVPGTNGATLATETAGADNPAVVDVVFADPGRDGTQSDANQYAIRSAALSVTKNVAVISDEFGSPNPKAIPNSVVEYTITVTNNSTTTAANAVTVTDNIPANTTYVGNTITLNAAPVADGTAFQGGPPARVVVAAGAVAQNGGTATVKFRVRINP
ncbi:MAG TPA: hypothetical protein VJT80_24475 [Steroidobacteraceae bacterium]|nr:hypothetical protein [Steroidobacteraceae bacterium]